MILLKCRGCTIFEEVCVAARDDHRVYDHDDDDDGVIVIMIPK